MDTTLTAILLGIVEGVTEFLPVSSTGHLILATELFGYDAAQWAMFNVVIQLGAILAVVYQYWGTLWRALTSFFKLEQEGLLFARNILIAFTPSVILGLIFKDQIDILLESPAVVAWALILGGIAILAIEKTARPGEEMPVAAMSIVQAVGIGCAQCLAMVPGVSRSGATIMGALAMGINRKTAAEFSFFLAIPTMLGATTLELLSKSDQLSSGVGAVGWSEVAIGFVVSFFVALVVIRGFVGFVSRRGFTPFAWYRIAVGAAAVYMLS